MILYVNKVYVVKEMTKGEGASCLQPVVCSKYSTEHSTLCGVLS